jgi:hypothetical protein
VVAGERSAQLKAAIKSPQIEFTKPVPLPEPLSLEQSIDLDPAGHPVGRRPRGRRSWVRSHLTGPGRSS